MLNKKLAIFIALTGSLTACSTLTGRHDTAAQIAAAGGLHERIIPAGIFNLTAWERTGEPGAPADVYIEGDGLAWLNKYTKSLNPTPPDPLALRLAALDKNNNVIYIARPCQYTGWNNAGACPDRYWTNARTAPEVIEAYRQVLDNLKAADHITAFNLIGYSGGAAVAILAAAERTDIASLRTVAGNTDYAVFSALHGVSAVDASQAPEDMALKLAHLPQQHFIGGKDAVVQADIFNGWERASGASACIHSTVVPEASHDRGWTEKWQELLEIRPECKTYP